MIAVAKVSDKFGNRGWPTQFGWTLLIVGFAIFLGAPTDNKPAHFAALILAETGHYGKQESPTYIPTRRLLKPELTAALQFVLL
jgi:hypothetical protein